MKRLLQQTTEALDLYLERDLITPRQHWCGIHFRWLYTLRNGAPGIRAIDPTHIGGMEIKLDDPAWREEREKEYLEAVKILYRHHCALLLINICIHNERPKFLSLHQAVTEKAAVQARRSIEGLCLGLDLLAKNWNKNKK